jgi:hypothetical protein
LLKYRLYAQEQQYIHQAKDGGEYNGRNNYHLYGADNVIPARPYDLAEFCVTFLDKLNYFSHVTFSNLL